MQTLLTRFPDVNGVFSINDQMAIGANLAAKQLNRTLRHHRHRRLAGSREALKTDTMFVGTAAQSPFNVGAQSVKAGYDLFQARSSTRT
jgi:ribose transport system substrate-binding protein